MAESDDRVSRAEALKINSTAKKPAAKVANGNWKWMSNLHLASAPTTRTDAPARCAPISVRIEAHPGMTLVVAAGDIDLYTAPQLLDPLLEIARSDNGSGVVLDLRGVTFIDSVGMRALISAHKTLNMAERPFALLTIPRSQPDRQVCLIGLDKMVLRVFDLSDIPWSNQIAEQTNSLAA